MMIMRYSITQRSPSFPQTRNSLLPRPAGKSQHQGSKKQQSDSKNNEGEYFHENAPLQLLLNQTRIQAISAATGIVARNHSKNFRCRKNITIPTIRKTGSIFSRGKSHFHQRRYKTTSCIRYIAHEFDAGQIFRQQKARAKASFKLISNPVPMMAYDPAKRR
ncbi:Uncharacterised protein [Cedecea neteri]|uniref:Uncharacterized protein n=1 Tax=Cedecea neteri TaxID=158822 RepID=A0A2X3IZC9_9ENTR|nr:Uncharacterised protein [Cedecea neteri]